MKPRGAILVLGIFATVLLAANICVGLRPASARAPEPSIAFISPEVSKPLPEPEIEPPSTNSMLAPEVKWEPVESDDYLQYIANLRKYGFPEELVREILIAEFDAVYAPRIDPLKYNRIPQDAPASVRRRSPVPEDIERMKQLRDLEIEKQDRLQKLLGVRIPRDMIRTPNSRNWEAYERAIEALPVEKRDAVKYLQENHWLNDDGNQALGKDYQSGDRGEMERYRQLSEQFDAELRKLLTPEEYEVYDRSVKPKGTELARRTIGMEPTEEEFLAMYKVTDEYWNKTGEVYGRWRGDRPSRDVVAEADLELAKNLQRVLGNDRYIDYQMSNSGMGQQMSNLAARYGLSPDAVRESYTLQLELDRASRSLPFDDPRRAELQEKLQERMGVQIWEAWNRGRNTQYNLEP